MWRGDSANGEVLGLYRQDRASEWDERCAMWYRIRVGREQECGIPVEQYTLNDRAQQDQWWCR